MIFYISFLVCLCLFIDAIWIMYLYSKTNDFIHKKDLEARRLK